MFITCAAFLLKKIYLEPHHEQLSTHAHNHEETIRQTQTVIYATTGLDFPQNATVTKEKRQKGGGGGPARRALGSSPGQETGHLDAMHNL